MTGSGEFSGKVERVLTFHDEAFIREAYRLVLSRNPDDEGRSYYLNRLRLGEPKERILKRLGHSAEGRIRGIDVRALNSALRKHRLARFPVIRQLLARSRPKRLPQPTDTWEAGRAASQVQMTKPQSHKDELAQLRHVADGLGNAIRGLEATLQRHENQLVEITSELKPIDHKTPVIEGLGHAIRGLENVVCRLEEKHQSHDVRMAEMLCALETADHKNQIVEALGQAVRGLENVAVRHEKAFAAVSKSLRADFGLDFEGLSQQTEVLGTNLASAVEALKALEQRVDADETKSVKMERDIKGISDIISKISPETLEESEQFLRKIIDKIEQKVDLIDITTLNLERKIHWIAVDNDNIRERLEFIRKETMFELRKKLSQRNIISTDRPEVAAIADTEGLFSNCNGRRLNLGCGSLRVEGYVNVDGRDLPGIDLVCDVCNLPFKPNTLDEIRAAHLIEHFPQRDLIDQLLPHWTSLLRPGGKLVLIAPNARMMIEQFAQGNMEWDHVKEVIMGGQEYDGDFHFAMLDPEGTKFMLLQLGYSRVDILEEARISGICLEFEIVATK